MQPAPTVYKHHRAHFLLTTCYQMPLVQRVQLTGTKMLISYLHKEESHVCRIWQNVE